MARQRLTQTELDQITHVVILEEEIIPFDDDFDFDVFASLPKTKETTNETETPQTQVPELATGVSDCL